MWLWWCNGGGCGGGGVYGLFFPFFSFPSFLLGPIGAPEEKGGWIVGMDYYYKGY